VTDPSRSLPILTAPRWREIPQLEHGFFSRRGGVSSGDFAELNFSFKVGDAPPAVTENWARARAHLGGRLEFVTMNQVHGARVVEVASPVADPEEADAMVSSSPGAGLSVLTADCVPVLLVAPRARTVAAIHAGWKGTLAGVAVQTVTRMMQRSNLRPTEMLAALGPSIGPCCYEVDASIADQIESHWGSIPTAVRRYVLDGNSKARLDLRAVNVALLVRAGVDRDAIDVVGGCTACDSRFFSHRRATGARGAGVTGRQLSFVGWST
jgi:YfiH family protein